MVYCPTHGKEMMEAEGYAEHHYRCLQGCLWYEDSASEALFDITEDE